MLTLDCSHAELRRRRDDIAAALNTQRALLTLEQIREIESCLHRLDAVLDRVLTDLKALSR